MVDTVSFGNRYKFDLGLDMDRSRLPRRSFRADVSLLCKSCGCFAWPEDRLLTIVGGRPERNFRRLRTKGRFNDLLAARSGWQGAFAVSAETSSFDICCLQRANLLGVSARSEAGSEALALRLPIFSTFMNCRSQRTAERCSNSAAKLSFLHSSPFGCVSDTALLHQTAR